MSILFIKTLKLGLKKKNEHLIFEMFNYLF